MSGFDPILALRPFVPARDHDLSTRFYEALGFVATYQDGEVAVLERGGFGFILQNVFDAAAAENCMVQLLVRDVDAWWAASDPARLVAPFGVRPPEAPAVRSWGLKVGFVFDPSGVLWHVAGAPA